MVWYLYIVKCKDNALYTGITTNVEKRVNKHNSKKGSKSVLGKLPVKLVYTETLDTKNLALKREYEIKSWTREKKIKLIKSSLNKGL